MSRDGPLPPGVEHCDIPGESDGGHRDDCCTVVNSHWQSPRCNCSELDEEDG